MTIPLTKLDRANRAALDSPELFAPPLSLVREDTQDGQREQARRDAEREARRQFDAAQLPIPLPL